MVQFVEKLDLFLTKNNVIFINFPQISSNLILFYIVNTFCVPNLPYEIKFILEISKLVVSPLWKHFYIVHMIIVLFLQ